MHVIVLMKLVPDVVEELDVGPDGRSLATEFLRLIPSESDEHALEQALLLKERAGGKVTVLAFEAPGIDDALFAALAKGADRALKIRDGDALVSTRVGARVVAGVLSGAPELRSADLVLTGAQAIDDLDGLAAPLLAYHLGWPYLGIVTGVQTGTAPGVAVVVKEFPGGVRGEFEVALPAVLGVQSAEKPPRYVPVAKVRAVMKSQQVDTTGAPAADEPVRVDVVQLAKPEATEHAEMLEGAPEAVAGKICEILATRGLL